VGAAGNKATAAIQFVAGGMVGFLEVMLLRLSPLEAAFYHASVARFADFYFQYFIVNPAREKR